MTKEFESLTTYSLLEKAKQMGTICSAESSPMVDFQRFIAHSNMKLAGEDTESRFHSLQLVGTSGSWGTEQHCDWHNVSTLYCLFLT